MHIHPSTHATIRIGWIGCSIHQGYWKRLPSHDACLSWKNDLQRHHWQVLQFANRISYWMDSLQWLISITSKFYDKLASIFLNTSIVKSGFSTIEWMKDKYQQCLIDFLLKSNFHSKQLARLCQIWQGWMFLDKFVDEFHLFLIT